LIFEAKQIPGMAGQELAGRVTCAKPYGWIKAPSKLPFRRGPNRWANRTRKRKRGDIGWCIRLRIKQNILRLLIDHNCEVYVVPAQTSAEDVLEMKPDGVFLSNGPGDPEPMGYAVENVRKMIGHVPIFGICLGHQVCGLALEGRPLS